MAQDFSDEAIRNARMKDSLAAPGFLYPLFGALGVLAVGVLHLVTGFTPELIALGTLSGAGGLGALAYKYYARAQQFSDSYLERLLERREQFRLSEIGNLQEDCASASFPEGEEELRGLQDSFDRLMKFFNEQKETNGKATLQAERFRIVVEDTYDEGVRNIQNALVRSRALQEFDDAKIERELEAWNAQLKPLGPTDLHRPALEEKIASHERVLAGYHKRQEELSKLLAESAKLRGALDMTYLESVDLVGTKKGNVFAEVSAVSRLEKTVAAARLIEERLRGNGVNPNEALYERLGQEREKES